MDRRVRVERRPPRPAAQARGSGPGRVHGGIEDGSAHGGAAQHGYADQSLSRAGLAASEDIPPSECARKGAGLDGERVGSRDARTVTRLAAARIRRRRTPPAAAGWRLRRGAIQSARPGAVLLRDRRTGAVLVARNRCGGRADLCCGRRGNGACQNSNDRVAAQDGLRTRNEGADRQATYGAARGGRRGCRRDVTRLAAQA